MEYLGFDTEEDEIIEVNAEAKERQAERDNILKGLATPQAIKGLMYLKDEAVRAGIVNANDTQMGVGIKQGSLDMLLYLINNAERLNNGR